MIQEQYQWLTSIHMVCIYGFLGMVIHFMKKSIKGETIADIWQYFSQHFKSTFIALVSTMIFVVAYYLALSNDSITDIISCFGIGYTCDSAFNKWDNKTEQ